VLNVADTEIICTYQKIRFFHHQDRRILLVDLSNCTPLEVDETTRRVPEVVTNQSRRSLLMLTDFSGSKFDAAAMHSIKEIATFDKSFVKKSALIGTLGLPRAFYDEMCDA